MLLVASFVAAVLIALLVVNFGVAERRVFHCKVMIVDGLLTSVGSTHFDPRSFHLNDEANLNIYDPAFARRMTEVFEADLQRCRRVTLQDWQRRPAGEKLRERAAAWLAPIL